VLLLSLLRDVRIAFCDPYFIHLQEHGFNVSKHAYEISLSFHRTLTDGSRRK
jgi:hypothetical protein